MLSAYWPITADDDSLELNSINDFIQFIICQEISLTSKCQFHAMQFVDSISFDWHHVVAAAYAVIIPDQ